MGGGNGEFNADDDDGDEDEAIDVDDDWTNRGGLLLGEMLELMFRDASQGDEMVE